MSDVEPDLFWATNPKAAQAALVVLGGLMHICYVDEAGCPGALPARNSNVQPTLVLTALFIPQQNLAPLTCQFLTLKSRFNPGLRAGCNHFLDVAKKEIKGSDLRGDIRRANRNRRRAVFGFVDSALELLTNNDARILARVYVKGPGQPFDGRAVYTASMQALCAGFQRFLEEQNSQGLIIADYRTPALNSTVSHSIFTQKFRVDGDPYCRILDMPTFGHSENHIPLQITDLLCSTILTPMVSSAYCVGHIDSVHVHPNDNLIRIRYASAMRELCYRYETLGRMKGGITLHDAIARRSATALFAP
jgi:hypothetical protein